MKHFILFTFLQIIISSANAQGLYINKNYKHFFNEVQEEAKKGNVVAIKEMGDIYNFGRQYMSTFTGTVDYKKAMDYYLLAASYGYPYAQWEIARMYYLGKGVEADKEKSIEWQDKAFANFKTYAEDGDANAMDHLVDYYKGIENDKYKDYVKAFYWAFRELEAGNPSGATEIASLYEFGDGVEKNVPNTYVWYARFCIEAKKKGWPVDQYLDYKELSTAGFSVADWDVLAAFTYGLYIPHVSVNDDDGISNAVITSLNLLANRNDDILATVNSIKSSTQKVNSQSTNTFKSQKRNNAGISLSANNLTSQHRTNSINKNYDYPPEVENLYYKSKDGSVVKLRLWKIKSSSSGDPNLDNYMKMLTGDPKWGAELSPGLLAYNKFEIKGSYFEYKQFHYGRQTECIRVARDLSWVSGSSLFGGGVECVYNLKATKQEYERYLKNWKKAAQIMQSGGPHPSFSNTSPNNNKLKLEKLPNKHGYTTCKGCGGNGKCHICGGTGKQSTSEYDAVLGRSINTLTDCGICHGTGNCGVCFGVGKIRY